MHIVIRGHSRHVATVGTDELINFRDSLDKHSPEYKTIQKELARRPQAQDPVYKPVVMGKVEVKDENGKSKVIDAQVRGYQSFSGGSRQTTERQKGKGIPSEWC